ncbi:MAG: hypothetical protein IMW96_05845 [Thermoanaerobacteraceae bacterium]|nr:hypothetical protein [Thermoanaerobacteraceae bacterium]
MAKPADGTALCRLLLEGKYPSHVRELAATGYPLALYEAGLKDGFPAFEGGGYVSIPEIPAGASTRSSRYPDLLEDSTFLRILCPAGGWVSAATLEALADLAEDYGLGLIHFTTGGTLEIYTPRENMVPLVRELNRLGLDVGSTGDDLRCVIACCGPARCDAALIDAPALATYLGERFMEDQQYPGFPHKCKSGVGGCPNDCIRAMMQRDNSFVGVYRDLPLVDEQRFGEWVARGGPWRELAEACPGTALKIHEGSRGLRVEIEGEKCLRCMTCINFCPAIEPGRERGVAWVVGGKYGRRGGQGPMVGHVLVPFIPVRGPEDYPLLGDLFGALLELWTEHGKTKERMGDFVSRWGLERIRRELGLEP